MDHIREVLNTTALKREYITEHFLAAVLLLNRQLVQLKTDFRSIEITPPISSQVLEVKVQFRQATADWIEIEATPPLIEASFLSAVKLERDT